MRLWWRGWRGRRGEVSLGREGKWRWMQSWEDEELGELWILDYRLHSYLQGLYRHVTYHFLPAKI